ncbi:MAG: hypothetical protein E7321_06070, partial [Clostridiales bacterium]|nr:hypothetical protein [Clostridiales bacterium]
MIGILLLLVFLPVSACAQEMHDLESLQPQMDSVLSGLDFSQLEPIQFPGLDEALSVEALVRSLASGSALSPEDAVAHTANAFFDALAGLGSLMLSIMLPVLLSSLLMHVLACERRSLVRLSRSVCFVLILIPVLLLVFSEMEHTRETITKMTLRMDKLLPMLLTLLTALGGSASSAFWHPMVVAASGSMVFLAREVTLRLVLCTCAVTAVNHLSDRAHLTRMAQLLRSSV